MLFLDELIIESDQDLEIVSSVAVGFDEQKFFVVELKHTDHDEPACDYEVRAIVERDDASSLAARLEVKPEALPAAMARRFAERTNSSVPSEVEALFQQILEFILDHGARYRIVRS